MSKTKDRECVGCGRKMLSEYDRCVDCFMDNKPAPVSATEPDAVRMLREGMRGQHALFNVNQEYVCAVAPLLEYIDALTARLAEAESEVVRLEGELVTANAFIQDAGEHRLAEAERVTEEQVSNAIHAYDDAYPKSRVEKMRAALTAARGGG